MLKETSLNAIPVQRHAHDANEATNEEENEPFSRLVTHQDVPQIREDYGLCR